MEKSFTRNQMRKRMTAAAVAGIFIGLIGVSLFIYFTNPLNDLKNLIGGRVDKKKADENLGEYRKNGALLAMSLFHKNQKLECLLHDSASVDSIYFIYNKFREANTALLKGGKKWGLGLYPSIAKGRKAGQSQVNNPDSVARLCIYFIPTVYQPSSSNNKEPIVYDYFKYGKNPDIYPQSIYPKSAVTPLANASFYVYDQGTLFP